MSCRDYCVDMTGAELVVQLWNLVWLGEGPTAFEDLLAPSFVRHTREGTSTSTPAEYRADAGRATRNITGTEVRVDRLDTAGDHVHARITLLGVSLASGEKVAIATIGDYRVHGGCLAESWVMHQSGLDWG